MSSSDEGQPTETEIHREDEASSPTFHSAAVEPEIPSPPPSPAGGGAEGTAEREEDTQTDIERNRTARQTIREQYHHKMIWTVLKKQRPEVADAILSLCMSNSYSGRAILNHGRYGYYALWSFRWAAKREGESLFERAKSLLSPLQWALLENLRDEGMVFASYDSLLEYLENNTDESSAEGA